MIVRPSKISPFTYEDHCEGWCSHISLFYHYFCYPPTQYRSISLINFILSSVSNHCSTSLITRKHVAWTNRFTYLLEPSMRSRSVSNLLLHSLLNGALIYTMVLSIIVHPTIQFRVNSLAQLMVQSPVSINLSFFLHSPVSYRSKKEHVLNRPFTSHKWVHLDMRPYVPVSCKACTQNYSLRLQFWMSEYSILLIFFYSE